MPRAHVVRSRWLPALAFTVAFGGSALVATQAHAGKVRFGTEPLSTDDSGKITSEGESAAVTTVPSLPGEEVWPVHLWASLDKGAPGPLYVEFFGSMPGSGKRYKLPWHHEENSYDGGDYISVAMELEGNVGFNRDRTYTVELNQLNDKGKNVKLASGKITLAYTEAAEDEGDEGGDDEGNDEADELDEQDVLDSFAGGDDENEGDEAPPPVAPPKKKGCHVDPGAGAAPGLLVLMLLGAAFVRRRN